MKKLVSILLCALMLIGSLTLTAFAEDIVYGDSKYQLPDTEFWESGNTYTIKSGSTFVVPSGRTLNVPLESKLIVEKDAALVVLGQLNVSGEVLVHGTLKGNNITGTGPIDCEVRFPSLADKNNNLSRYIQDVRYLVSGTNDSYGDINVPIEDYTAVPTDGDEVMVPYNTYIYVRVRIAEAAGEDRYDDKLYPVFFNDQLKEFAQTSCPILVTTGGDITYGSWPQDESRLYNTYTIELPEGEGYTVYGRNGENGADGPIRLKYGQSFSFRVELEEDFNKSAYQVYVFNGSGWTTLEKDVLLTGIQPAVPDAEGYYTINKITGDYTIFVEGVLANEMLDIFSKIFSIFQQIWKAIMDIFEGFDFAGLLGNLGI